MAPLSALTPGSTLLDAVLPRWDFHEFHATHVRATPAAVWHALQDLRPADVPLAGALMALRRGRPGWLWRRGRDREHDRPLLEVMRDGGFAPVAEAPGRELVLVIAGRFWELRPQTRVLAGARAFADFDEPGCAKAAINWRLEPAAGGGCRLSTETRILAVDERARRRFAAYWWCVHPGSALIRRVWLRAVRRRAESAATEPA